jgi:hypothetical protein
MVPGSSPLRTLVPSNTLRLHAAAASHAPHRSDLFARQLKQRTEGMEPEEKATRMLALRQRAWAQKKAATATMLASPSLARSTADKVDSSHETNPWAQMDETDLGLMAQLGWDRERAARGQGPPDTPWSQLSARQRDIARMLSLDEAACACI